MGVAESTKTTKSVADEVDAESLAEEAETESVADNVVEQPNFFSDLQFLFEEEETESMGDEEEAESIVEEAETESEAEEVEAEEVHSEAEAKPEAVVAIEVSKPKRWKSKIWKPPVSGWASIGNVQDCHPLSPKETNANRMVLRRSQRLTVKIGVTPVRSRRSTRCSRRSTRLY